LETLGVHSDGLGTTSIAGGIRVDRALPPELTKMMQLSMQHIYHRFLQVVASGRHMPVAKVAALAEGRVWSGLDAQRLGLVDSLGDFNDAIQAAATLASIEQDYSTRRITLPLGLRDMIMVELFGDADSLAAQILAHIGTRLSILTGTWLSTPALQSMTDVSRLAGFMEGKPGIFAMCNVHVE